MKKITEYQRKLINRWRRSFVISFLIIFALIGLVTGKPFEWLCWFVVIILPIIIYAAAVLENDYERYNKGEYYK